MDKIYLTKKEFSGISTIVINQFRNGQSEDEIKRYLETLFDRIEPKKKRSTMRFLADHDKEVVLFVLISIISLTGKIAIESYFLK